MSQSRGLSAAVKQLHGAGFDIDYEEKEEDARQQAWLDSLLANTEITEIVADTLETKQIENPKQVAVETDMDETGAEMEDVEQMEEQKQEEEEAEEEEEEEEEEKDKMNETEQIIIDTQMEKSDTIEEEEEQQLDKIESENRTNKRQKQQEEDERNQNREHQTLVWENLCAKYTNLRYASPKDASKFDAPLANGERHKDIYDLAVDKTKVMIVDVPADGSCLFHAIFSCVWREVTGEVIRANSTTPLASLWEASRLYEFDDALEEFRKVQVSAALGAIWSSCTHAMRLFVVARWCFGGDVLTDQRMRELLCDAREEPRNTSEQYAVTLWTTLAQSVALLRYVKDTSSEQEEADDDKQQEDETEKSTRFVKTMTIALASQHLIDTIEREAKALRTSIIEHDVNSNDQNNNNSWSDDTTDDLQRFKYQLFAGEGYEDAWFGANDRIRSGCTALTYTTDPYTKHLYPKSYWASVSACEPLSEVLGFNIYVLDPQPGRPATSTAVARPAQVNLYPFVAPSTPQKTRDIILYVLGDRNHFGYGLPLDTLQENPITGCLTQKNVAFDGTNTQLRSVLLAMANKWIAQRYTDEVPHILSQLWTWWNNVIVARDSLQQQDETADNNESEQNDNVVGERMQCVLDSMAEENEIALQTANRRLRNDPYVLLRAWNIDQQDFDEQTTRTDVQSLITLIFESAADNIKNLSLINSTFTDDDSSSSLIDQFLTMLSTLTDQIYDPLVSLVEQIMSYEDAIAVLRDVEKVRETRPFVEFAHRIHSTVSLLISVVYEKIQQDGSANVAVPSGLARVIDIENAWFENLFLPFEKSLKELSETAIRYVLARMQHSVAAPCVVPLFIFGEPILFFDRRRLTVVGSDLLASKPNATVADLDLYVSSVDDGKTATTRRMLDIAGGKKIKKIVNKHSLVEFLQQYVILSILEQQESEENEMLGGIDKLKTVPPLATGFSYINDEQPPGKVVYLQDVVEQTRAHRLRLRRRRGESVEQACSVRENGKFDGFNAAVNMLALLEPSTCLSDNFGWIGPQLRGLTLKPGVGQVDLLGLVEGSAIRADRLVGRLYALFNIDGAQNTIANFVLRGQDIVERTSPTDETPLLSPLFRPGGESASTLLKLIRGSDSNDNGEYFAGFYGNAPTDWLLRQDLRRFLESNELDETLHYLDWALLNGTTGERRLSLARSLHIQLPLRVEMHESETVSSYRSVSAREFASVADEVSEDSDSSDSVYVVSESGDTIQQTPEPKKKKRKSESPATMKIARPEYFADIQPVETLDVYRPVASTTTVGQQTVFGAPITPATPSSNARTNLQMFNRQGVMTSGVQSPSANEYVQETVDLSLVSAQEKQQKEKEQQQKQDFGSTQSDKELIFGFQWPVPLSPSLQPVGDDVRSEIAPKETFGEASRSKSPIDRLAVTIYLEMGDRLPVYSGLESPPIGSGLESFEASPMAFTDEEQQREYNLFLDNVMHGLVRGKLQERSDMSLNFMQVENIVSTVKRWFIDNQVPGRTLSTNLFWNV